MKYHAIILCLLIFVAGCSSTSNQTQVCNTPLMGYAFHPGAITSNDAQRFIGEFQSNANLMLLHFGDKVPWKALAQCNDLNNCDATSNEFNQLMQQLQIHSSNFDGKVYVAASALNNDRDSIATNWDGSPAIFTDFSDPDLHKQYQTWLNYLKQQFEPDYFSQGIEINMYAKSNPEDFDNLLELMQENAQNTIGPSIQLEFYKNEWLNGDKSSMQKIHQHNLGSGFAFSTYPEILDVPVGYDFSEYGFDINNKPIMISETGISSSKQISHLSSLLSIDDTQKLLGINWFFFEADNKLLSQLPNEYPHTIFKKSALNTGAGLQSWKEALSC